MYHRSFRVFLYILFFFGFILFSIASCDTPPTSTTPANGVQTSPTTQPANTVITWPFDPMNGQWDIINGYREGDHAGYATWAMDFAKCLPDAINSLDRTCNDPNGSGWDKTNTLGAEVYAPVSGTIVWADDNCFGLSIEIDGHPSYRLVLFHIDPPAGETWSDLASKHAHYRQTLDKIGKVSAGYCSQSGTTGYHIHMALYHCTTNCTNDPSNQRVGNSFSNLWNIDNCQYPDDGTTSNKYQGFLVPCHSITTPSPTPPTPVLVPTPTQPLSPSATPSPNPKPTLTPSCYGNSCNGNDPYWSGCSDSATARIMLNVTTSETIKIMYSVSCNAVYTEIDYPGTTLDLDADIQSGSLLYHSGFQLFSPTRSPMIGLGSGGSFTYTGTGCHGEQDCTSVSYTFPSF